MSDYGSKCKNCGIRVSYRLSLGFCTNCAFLRVSGVGISGGVLFEEDSALSVKEVKPSVGKPPISLIPREAIEEMAKAFDYGTGKHGRYAFRDGVEFTKLIDAALRHVLAVADGEDIDEESKSLHAANAMSNLAMLIYMIRNKPEMDDRYKKGN